jgi:flagellar biosynthesis protein FlhB
MTVTVTLASVPHGWEIQQHSDRRWSILIESSIVAEHPYTALSYICLALSAITIRSYSPNGDVSPHDILVYAEEMTLQAGLGIYVLNATKESTSHSWRATHRILRPLQTYTTNSYTEAFLVYCRNNKISSTQYDEHLLPSVQKQLDIHTLHPKSHIKRYIQSEKRLHERFALLGLCLVVFLFFMPSLWGAIPKPLSPQQQSWRQKIDTLKQQHTACEASLKIFFDTVASPDILSSRSLQAKKHECDSIKQKHDVLVGLLRTSRN